MGVDGVCLFIAVRVARASHMFASYGVTGRVPSECWPIVTSDDGRCVYGPLQAHKAEIHTFEECTVLCLKFRKNRPLGSKLVRTCWCARCPSTCPVHVLVCILQVG